MSLTQTTIAHYRDRHTQRVGSATITVDLDGVTAAEPLGDELLAYVQAIPRIIDQRGRSSGRFELIHVLPGTIRQEKLEESHE